jgi:hypothetical protein
MRHSPPLLPEETPAPGTFGVFALESGFISVSDEGRERCPSLTLLVDFSGVARCGKVLRQLDGAVLNARVLFRRFQAAGRTEVFIDFIQSYQAARVCAVVVLPIEPAATGELEATMTALARLGDGAACIVAVSQHPEHWRHLTGVTGHVRTRASRQAFDAATVFKVFTVPSAPTLFACVDMYDLVGTFEAGTTPVAVGTALWHRSEQRLQVLGDAVAALPRVGYLVVAPLWTVGRMRDLAAICRQLRDVIGADAALTLAASTEHFIGCELDEDVCPIALLYT